ncbi:hypothetical protein STCU_00167 [Strigomonas culicis]|nr:hypothetical protein STCU_00167 [Strigomonas culicis]|eukprot:EPY37130.1 hypothetical protein STCU_00167 [Strigomonas culicis]
MIAKLLATNRRNEFIFVESSHIFYPYFLSMLTEFRAHPEKRPQKTGKTEGTAAAAPTTAAAATATATRMTTGADGVVRTEGGTAPKDAKREELIWRMEQEARRYLDDPFPSHYALDLKEDTIDLPPFAMDLMALTAQYSAKYGELFLRSVEAKQKRNPNFRFLQDGDVRHGVLQQLVEAYRRILAFDPDATETRLEQMGERHYVLDTVVAEKTKYAQAALARRQAALLTDDQLRATLNWSAFKVVKAFSLNDLLLDGVVPPTATSHQRHAAVRLAPPPPPSVAAATEPAGGGGAPPSFAPVFMSANLLSGTTHSGKAPTAPVQQRHPPREEEPEADPTAVYTVLEEVEEENSAYAIDPITGARVHKKRPREA